MYFKKFDSIKAVLFDMDGVLIEAKEWHYEALNMALSHFGLNISRHNHLNTFDGLPTRDKLKILSETDGLPEGLHQIINDLKQKYTLRLAAQKTRPTFCHEYLLMELKRADFKLACCSNSIRKTIDDMLTRANIIDYFDLILSNQDVDKAKPAPDIYQKAIKYFNVQPKQCLVLEDNKNGIDSALAAGAHVLEIKNTTDVNITNLVNFMENLKL